MTTTSMTKKPIIQTSFYGITAILIFLIAMGGFSSTYFIPIADGNFQHGNPYIHIHAIVATLWLLLFLVQTHLVAGGNRMLHMTLGKAGAVIALLFIATGFMTFWTMIKIGVASTEEFRRFGAEVLGVAPVVDLLSFTLLVGFGLTKRKQPQVHKRLMYMASCLFITPGMFRVVQWWVGGQPTPENGGLLIPLTFTAFIVAGPIYDKIKTGKVDRTYWWALPVWVFVFFIIPISIVTGFWVPVAHWIASV